MRDWLERLRMICSRFPEAEEDLLQDRPLFHVRRRRFVILNPADAPYRKRWSGFENSLHFATPEEARPRLSADARFQASPHHGFRGWMSLSLNLDSDWGEIQRLIESAYRSVAAKELIDELEHSDFEES